MAKKSLEKKCNEINFSCKRITTQTNQLMSTEKQQEQPNNPMHGVKLVTILEELVAHHGWDGLAEKINVNCFKSDPSIKSGLTFLRRTPWARDKVEQLYLRLIRKKK